MVLGPTGWETKDRTHQGSLWTRRGTGNYHSVGTGLVPNNRSVRLPQKITERERRTDESVGTSVLLTRLQSVT